MLVTYVHGVIVDVSNIDQETIIAEAKRTLRSIDVQKKGQHGAAALFIKHIKSLSQRKLNAGRRHFQCDLACFCRICNHRYKSVRLYIQHHQEEHASQPIHCTSCNAELPLISKANYAETLAHLTAHYNDQRRDIPAFACSQSLYHAALKYLDDHPNELLCLLCGDGSDIWPSKELVTLISLSLGLFDHDDDIPIEDRYSNILILLIGGQQVILLTHLILMMMRRMMILMNNGDLVIMKMFTLIMLKRKKILIPRPNSHKHSLH
jgi:hypothetical protein